jgi:phage gp36-like protein
MSYATQAMLVKRFGERQLVQLTDRGEVPTGQIDTDLVAQELANTDAVINGYVGNRYRLPLDPTPDLVTDLAISIALYKLHAFAPDPKVKDDYDQAIRTLRDISNNVVKLDAAGVEPASSGASGVQFIDRERPLTPESMRGFI